MLSKALKSRRQVSELGKALALDVADGRLGSVQKYRSLCAQGVEFAISESVGGIMSTPVRGVHDDGPMNDGLLNFAQKRTRLPEHDPSSGGEASRVNSSPLPDALETLEPPWKQNKQRGVIAGVDVAVMGQGSRPSLAPDRIADLQFPDCDARTTRAVRGIMGITAVLAAGIGVYLWGSARSTTPPTQKLAVSLDRTDRPSELRTPVANIEASSPDPNRVAVSPGANDSTPGAAINITRSTADESAVAPKPGAYTPQPNDQDSPASPAAVPPQFTVVDRKNLQLDWSSNGAVPPPKPAPLEGNSGDNTSMMKKGADSMARRDIAVARLIFQRVAQSGDAAAAFALAETYDPSVLRKLGSREEGFSDIALAQSWYEKARDLGSTAAPERIVSLTQASK